MKCNKCEVWFYSEKALNIHKGRIHTYPKESNVPDLIKMGVMKRKLTHKEAKTLTKEVCLLSDNPNVRFTLAMIKAIDITNRNLHDRPIKCQN